MKRKSSKLWIAFLILPFPLLIGSVFLQFIARLALGSDSGLMIIVNLLSLLVGVTAILMMLGLPIWIVMLVKVSNYNSKLNAQPPMAPQYPPVADQGQPYTQQPPQPPQPPVSPAPPAQY